MHTQHTRILEALESVDLELVRNPLGYHHQATDWLDNGDDTTYYLATDGDLYIETDEKRQYIGTLSDNTLARLR